MKKITEEERTQIVKLRNEGKSYNEIVRELGGKVSPQYCQQYYNSQKLKTLTNK